MFTPAYVILPFSDVPPAEAIRASVEPFRRGTDADLPMERLAFRDETEALRAVHGADLAFTDLGRQGLRVEGEPTWYLDTGKVRDEMRRRGIPEWRVRFRDVEPDLDAFGDAWSRRLVRHPVTGRFGMWLNPIGHWDWWDLGGRFDGMIQRGRRRPGRVTTSVLSSGPSAGRAILGNVAAVLSDALGEPRPEGTVAETDANVEVVSRLLDDLVAGQGDFLPGAVVLPPGSVDDTMRWVSDWPDVGPAEALAWLGLPPAASWPEVVEAAYRRFPDHWAACLAVHI